MLQHVIMSALSSSMNVRLPDALKARLEAVAGVSRLKPSDLIRMAVEEFCDHVEANGSITIPLNLTDSSPPRKKKP